MSNKISFSMYFLFFLLTSFILFFISESTNNYVINDSLENFFYGVVFNGVILIFSNYFLLKNSDSENTKKYNKNYILYSAFLYLVMSFSFYIFSISANFFYLMISAIILICLNISSIYNLNVIYKNDKFYNIYINTVQIFLVLTLILNLIFNTAIFIDIISSAKTETFSSILIAIFNIIIGLFLYYQNSKNVDDIKLDYKEIRYFMTYIVYTFLMLSYPFIFVFFITLK